MDDDEPQHNRRKEDSLNDAYIERIVRSFLDVYEKETGMPRHIANSDRLDVMEDILQQIKGAIKVVAWAAAAAATSYTVMQVISGLHKTGVLN